MAPGFDSYALRLPNRIVLSNPIPQNPLTTPVAYDSPTVNSLQTQLYMAKYQYLSATKTCYLMCSTCCSLNRHIPPYHQTPLTPSRLTRSQNARYPTTNILLQSSAENIPATNCQLPDYLHTSPIIRRQYPSHEVQSNCITPKVLYSPL